jgi:hypothetical protein
MLNTLDSMLAELSNEQYQTMKADGITNIRDDKLPTQDSIANYVLYLLSFLNNWTIKPHLSKRYTAKCPFANT